MPLAKGSWQVTNIRRRALYGPDRGKLVVEDKSQKVSFSINDSGELQLGCVGAILQWTPLARFSIAFSADSSKATIKDTFLGSEFELVMLWQLGDAKTMHDMLVLGEPFPADGPMRILGLEELEPPDGKPEVLRAVHAAAPPYSRGAGLFSKAPVGTVTSSLAVAGRRPAYVPYVAGGVMLDPLGDLRLSVVPDDADLGPYIATRAVADPPLALYNDDDWLPQPICDALLGTLAGDDEKAPWCSVFGAPMHPLSLKDVRSIVRADGDPGGLRCYGHCHRLGHRHRLGRFSSLASLLPSPTGLLDLYLFWRHFTF